MCCNWIPTSRGCCQISQAGIFTRAPLCFAFQGMGDERPSDPAWLGSSVHHETNSSLHRRGALFVAWNYHAIGTSGANITHTGRQAVATGLSRMAILGVSPGISRLGGKRRDGSVWGRIGWFKKNTHTQLLTPYQYCPKGCGWGGCWWLISGCNQFLAGAVCPWTWSWQVTSDLSTPCARRLLGWCCLSQTFVCVAILSQSLCMSNFRCCLRRFRLRSKPCSLWSRIMLVSHWVFKMQVFALGSRMLAVFRQT